jgi:hypothetical protein
MAASQTSALVSTVQQYARMMHNQPDHAYNTSHGQYMLKELTVYSFEISEQNHKILIKVNW